jgi:outer membrane receptor for monomeric catechols
VSINYPDTDRTTIYHFSSLSCSHHFSLLVSIRYSVLTTTVSSMLSQKIANDHFVSISSKQMGQMSSQNLLRNELFSSDLLVSMGHMYSTVNMSMRSRGLEHFMKEKYTSSRSHLSSPHLCSTLSQGSRSSMSVLHQDPRRHNSL